MGQAADKSPHGSALRRGWGRGGVCAGGMLIPTRTPPGMAEPGDEAREAPHICCFVCLLLPCCFTGGGAINLQTSPTESSGGVHVGG